MDLAGACPTASSHGLVCQHLWIGLCGLNGLDGLNWLDVSGRLDESGGLDGWDRRTF